MVAIASRLRSRWLFTALATPTPPTSSAVSPTMVRNCVKRSTLRSSCGEALLRRADFPAGFRQLRARGCGDRLARRIAGVAVGQPQAIMPAHQAAGLQQAGRAQRGLADQQARAEADAAGELVGLVGQRGADFEGGIADGERRARLEVEPRQQASDRRRRRKRRRASRQRVGERHGRIELASPYSG